VTGDYSYPFLQPAFLGALENTGAAAPAQGWQSCHWQQPDWFLPLYLRDQSWGEFVFDQGWEHAYRRAGLAYFPKLVTAIPFSPISGPRWRGTFPGADTFWEGMQARVAEHQASGWHLLFPDAATRTQLASLPLVSRQACHFRWNNRDYRSFDEFLGALTSRKRKMVRKERAQLAGQGLEIRWCAGAEIPAHWWPQFYRCYAMTYLRRGQRPYLSLEFFQQLAASELADQIALAVAMRGEEMLAAAFYLFDAHQLYGRYWGAVQDIDGLHFELCYYQGIEFCIARGLSRFDPGVQGEHKILRGFEPEITWSLHWLADGRFQRAIADFCEQEARAVQAYQREARCLLPYRQVE